ncbi:hypothetical protein NST99_14625 [Paenibacillus sp. FSL L8-0470]|uniref:hypothetical protein n=1 Tax=unclassified Paenibacillus TaxID=185978 RepID=UPI0030FCBF59
MLCILEMQLHTGNYKVMPDQTVKLYDYLNEKERVARTLFDNGIVVSSLSIEGDTLRCSVFLCR